MRTCQNNPKILFSNYQIKPNRDASWKEPEQGPDPDQEIDEALTKFRLQTGMSAGSPILSFMRLAMKASAPNSRPGRNPRAPEPPRAGQLPQEQPDPVSYKPIEPASSAWVLVMIAAALIGLYFSYLARTGALN
jgi:hypothetical protein